MTVGSRCKARAHVEPVCGPAEEVVEVRDGKQRMQLLYTYTILLSLLMFYMHMSGTSVFSRKVLGFR